MLLSTINYGGGIPIQVATNQLNLSRTYNLIIRSNDALFIFDERDAKVIEVPLGQVEKIVTNPARLELFSDKNKLPLDEANK